jgi:hypothetical protein
MGQTPRPADGQIQVMNTAAVRRVQQKDGAVVLSSHQTSVLIQKPARSVLLLVICGAVAQEVGAPMFEEIAAAFQPDRKLTLFIDLEQALGTAVTVDVWVKFLSDNLGSIARIVILAVSRSTSLTANVIDHFVRKDRLFEILDDPASFQGHLAQAIAERRPLP